MRRQLMIDHRGADLVVDAVDERPIAVRGDDSGRRSQVTAKVEGLEHEEIASALRRLETIHCKTRLRGDRRFSRLRRSAGLP